MAWALWVLSFTVLAAVLFVLRRSFMLEKEIKQLKRDQYYAESRLKRVPDDIREAVEPLRLQLANVANGKPVSPDLIRTGRRYLDISAEEAERMLERDGGPQAGQALLLDVRTPKEYVVKHAVGAKLVPFEELEARYKNDIPETVEKIFVYCVGGDRSRLACDFLSRRGYTNLYNVQDGMQGWRGPTEGEGEVKFIRLEPRR
jgi:rhodanese-related sulfurtransferase